VAFAEPNRGGHVAKCSLKEEKEGQ
jgi:hypothetical protein